MLHLRYIVTLLAALSFGSVHALDIITLNGHRVVADSVVAQVKPGSAGEVRAMAAAGTEIKTLAISAPGLVELKRAGQVQAMSAEAKAASLEAWIKELKASGQFEFVEPNFVRSWNVEPNDQRYLDGSLWGLKNFGQAGGVTGADVLTNPSPFPGGPTNAWDITVGSTNVIVGIIDSGVRYTHRDLAPQMWINQDEVPANGIDDDNDGYVDNIHGVNAADGTGDPSDEVGHGTHVAGTVGAAANDGNPQVGVAWNVQLMAVRIGGLDGPTLSGIISGIDFAMKNGARIMNGSYGGYGFSQAEFNIMSAARNAGVLFVAAAGNDNNDNDVFPAYPASYDLDNIISVAAMNRRDQLAPFSNYGRNSVDVGAPGMEILSTYNGSDTDYAYLQGTSMASPHVAGVAALIASHLEGASYQEIRQRIFDGVVTLPVLASRTSTGGRVNAFNSLTAGEDGVFELAIRPAAGSSLSTGQPVLLSARVSDGPLVTNATVNVSGAGTNLTLNFHPFSTNNAPTQGSYTNTLMVPNAPGPFSLTFNISAPGKETLIETVTYNAVPRPANDLFRNPFKVPDVMKFIHVTSNNFATLETNDFGARIEPLHAGVPEVSSSIWYTWSSRARSEVLVDTSGSFPVDTVIAVYTGLTLNTLTEVISTNGPGDAAWLKFTAEPGETYKIAIAGVAPRDQGRIQVRFEVNGEPDRVPPVLEITNVVSGITVYTNKYDLAGRAFDPEPNASGIAEQGIQYFVSRTGELPPGELPTSAQGTTNWIAPVLLEVGVNYVTIWARDFAENTSPRQQVVLIYRPTVTTNDIFAVATPIALNEGSGSITGNNETATKENTEPSHAGNAGGKSLWYSFIPPQSGEVLFSTRGSNRQFDTLLAIYTTNVYVTNFAGSPFTNLVEVASNDDVVGDAPHSEVTFTVEGGRKYFVAVDGYEGDAGDFVLNYIFQPVQTFTLTTIAGAGGTITPAGTNVVYPQNAAISFQATPEQGQQFVQYRIYPTGNPGAARTVTTSALTVVLTNNMTVEAQFGPRVYTEDFEDGANAPGLTLGDWEVRPVSESGSRAATSGSTADWETSRMTLRASVRDGIGSFDFGVSSEAGFDFLEFWITDVVTRQTARRGRWSGEIAKQRFEVQLTAGFYEFEWRYVKDAAFRAGQDRAYVDNIDLPIVPSATPAGPISIQNGILAWRPPNITPGINYVIESSPDLNTWSFVSEFSTNAAGYPFFYDPVTPGETRFYRIRQR